MKELLKALSKVKSEIGAVTKSETNPFFKSKYFDINALLLHVDQKLEEHGLLLLQPIEGNIVFTKIYHVDTGQHVQSKLLLPDIQDPQKMGAAVTYYRRHTLQSLLALQAEDDDGNTAAKAVKTKKLRAITNDELNAAFLKLIPIDKIKKDFTITPEQEKTYLEGLENKAKK